MGLTPCAPPSIVPGQRGISFHTRTRTFSFSIGPLGSQENIKSGVDDPKKRCGRFSRLFSASGFGEPGSSSHVRYADPLPMIEGCLSEGMLEVMLAWETPGVGCMSDSLQVRERWRIMSTLRKDMRPSLEVFQQI